MRVKQSPVKRRYPGPLKNVAPYVDPMTVTKKKKKKTKELKAAKALKSSLREKTEKHVKFATKVVVDIFLFIYTTIFKTLLSC